MSVTANAGSYRRFSDWAAKSGLRWLSYAALGAIHLTAAVSMVLTEADWFGFSLFVLTWGLVNCLWIVLLRRPIAAAVLSLALIELIIVLSTFKYSVLWMTLNFLDVLIIDPDTIAFLLTIYPNLRIGLLIAAVLIVPLALLIWRIDPFRMRRSVAAACGAGCLAGVVGLSVLVPEEPFDQFQGANHVSIFSRSGVSAVADLMTQGWMEFDTTTTERLRSVASEECRPAKKPPHIIMVLDESSFDIGVVPGVKVPDGYAAHFQSFDGQARKLLVEATGGPTWYTEYNVLTGLSARSYGRLAYYVTRIAAGRVERGLPKSLRRCGYKTFTLYPAFGAFLSARNFQASAGVQQLIDSQAMKAGDVEPDRFYYDQALRLVEKERAAGPLFIFAYTVANHFPWWNSYRPELTPNWRALGNDPAVDEYIRRQTMSAQDYKDFVTRLTRDFPGESFLVVRFGDHQPAMGALSVDPAMKESEITRRIMMYDPRLFTTYYAIDAVNHTPADLSSAVSPVDAAYLPLIIQEAAGLPLDATFAEQKRNYERCRGLFYMCSGGAEARRFNRLLIDAGLIKGMVSR